MKWKAVLVATALAMALSVQGQVRLGVMGGYDLPDVSFSKHGIEDAISEHSGFFLGPTLRITLPIVNIGIDASALYDERRNKIKETGQTVKQQSVQIPVHLRLAYGLGDMASVFLFAGPQFGFSVGEDEKQLRFNNDDGHWSFRNSTTSVNLGVGFMLVNHLQLSANYSFALGTTSEISYRVGDIVEAAKAKDNTWQVSLAYYF